MPGWYLQNLLSLNCTFMGGLGGILYCLRAVYLNRCVLKKWDDNWVIWYYLRPITSCISGFVSSIFLKAGLLALNSSIQHDGIPYGYLTIAFIAGYNVDNFLKKIESVALNSWGIKKTRASEEEFEKEKEKK